MDAPAHSAEAGLSVLERAQRKGAGAWLAGPVPYCHLRRQVCQRDARRLRMGGQAAVLDVVALLPGTNSAKVLSVVTFSVKIGR
jgi:hypothetical protein